MRQDYTDMTVILDRTGSMAKIAKDMMGGFDAFIKTQQQEPGECRVTLVQFDRTDIQPITEEVYVARPVAEVPPLVLIPRGNTPLWDAVGLTITRTGERLKAIPEPDRPGHVLVYIITDGEENASRDWTAERVKRLVQEQQDKYHWVFQFLGANINSFYVGAQMGLTAGKVADYSPDTVGVRGMFANNSARASTLRSQPSSTPMRDYTDEERKRQKKGQS